MKRMYVVLAVILLFCVGVGTGLSQMLSSDDVKIEVQTHTQTQPAPREPFNREKRRAEKRAEMREKMKGRHEMREEMHRRIRDLLLNGQGNPDDLFADMEAAFEESMKESFADIDRMQMGSAASNFQSEWKESKSGRVLEITPQSKDQKLNIDVNAEAITIKGDSQQITGSTSVMSSFSNSFPVPDDCDGTKVKLNSVDGKILVELPYKAPKTVSKPVAPPKDDRKPIQPSEGDIEI